MKEKKNKGEKIGEEARQQQNRKKLFEDRSIKKHWEELIIEMLNDWKF